jgi:hypothetical protein
VSKQYIVRLILALLLCWPLAVFAVDRDLDDCTVGSTPTALAPLDLDNCTISDGDDISGILIGLASTYGDVYVRAPSRTANVVAAYTVFTVDDFYFLEDEDGRNTFLIQHKVVDGTSCSGAACEGFFTLWRLEQFDHVVIGGQSLSITFVGNHPGLANCAAQNRPALQTGWGSGSADICDINKGLVDIYVGDGVQPALFDFRANVKFSQMYALMSGGYNANENMTNRVQQVNVAGVFYATSGINTYLAVKDVWFDPDRTFITDPYVRIFGWTGTVGVGTEGGLPMGCNDTVNDQLRASAGAPYYSDSITGGISIQYGWAGFIPRFSGTIGTAEAPFVIRIQDLAITGPGTGYQAGVRVKGTGEATFFKGDPNDKGTDTPQRFLRIIRLPDEYGSGPASNSMSGCPANSFVGADADSNFLRFENSIGISRYTRNFDVEFVGDWRTTAQGGTFERGELVRMAFDTYRAYHNTVRVASDTTFPDTLTMYDTGTATGPGTFANIAVADFNANNPGQDNLITDTNVSGTVAISANTEDTTIANVNFTGTARAVITIGASANAIVSDLCVPNGSTITGAGTLTYEGSGQSLPYTIPNSTANCSITPDPRPGPVTGGSVN